MRRISSFIQTVVILGVALVLVARFRVSGWLLIAGVIVAAVWTSRRDAAATVEIRGDKVIIRMIGLDKLWAFRSSLSLPLREVDSVEVVEDRRDLPRPRWRTGGTRLPGVVAAGWFRGDGLSFFYAVHRSHRVLVLGLRGSHPDIVVVSVENPGAVAERIRTALDRR